MSTMFPCTLESNVDLTCFISYVNGLRGLCGAYCPHEAEVLGILGTVSQNTKQRNCCTSVKTETVVILQIKSSSKYKCKVKKNQ